jgi:beta-N-acetylhexosaminidase
VFVLTVIFLKEKFVVITIVLALFCLSMLASLQIAKAQTATLEQMAGQMIMVGFQGNIATSQSVVQTRNLIKQGKIGGVMYLKTNVSSLANVKAMNESFLSAGVFLPPFIAIDQEGGSIERLTKAVGFAEIPSAAHFGSSNSPQRAQKIYSTMAKSLANLGVNMNFGPVVDLNINKQNPIIAKYGRSYGDDVKTVVTYAEAFVSAHRIAGVITALKHFPGHGSSAGDSHVGFVDITKTWQAKELDPYRIMVKDNMVDMVMVGQLFHQKLSTEAGVQLPSSLSPNWIAGVLRKQIGYDGVVISDDMEMAAIREKYSLKETIIRAINAGTDILLFSNTANYRIGLADEVRAIIVAEAKASPNFAAKVEASYKRIARLKKRIAK